MSNLDFRDIEKLPIDFEDIVQTLKTRIQNRLPNRWTDFLASNFGIELLEAFAYEAALMNYYINANINECFMPTAKTKNAVYNLAKTIGYKPRQPSQAIATVKFYLETPHDKNIYIPMYTKLITDSGIPFYTTKNVILYAGETSVEVIAKSGTLNSETFISTGIVGYKYKLRQFPVNAIEYVKVNDVEYQYIDFIDIEAQERYYTTEYSNDFSCSIKFGDGVYGINPAKNSIIEVFYVTGADNTHNVAPFSINNIIDPIYDSSNMLVNVNVTNIHNAVGGSSSESVDEVKRNAPSIYRTQHRCVTTQDFRDILLAQPGVSKVSIIDHYTMNEIGIFGVKAAVIPDGGGYPNSAFKKNLLSLLEEKKIVATQVEVIDPTYIPFDVDISIQTQPKIPSNIITNNIRKVIYNYLHWQNRDFGESVSKSEIYRLVSDVPGVLAINSLSLNESAKIYVNEIPEDNSNKIKVVDLIKTLNVGTKINILNLDGITVLTTKIIDIDNDIITISSPIKSYMNIGHGSLIYPVLEVDGYHKYGTKEIRIKNQLSSSGNTKEYPLLNTSYLTVYFNSNPEKKYQILFRNGDIIYLDKPIDTDILDGTEIIVTHKKNTPTLDSVVTIGSSVLKLKSYPRFSKGASLIKNEMITFTNSTISMIRTSSGIDNINSAMNDEYLSKIEKIYINANNVFTPNIDYILINNGKTIIWTDIGKAKLPANTRYYIDIVEKVINTTSKDIIYYVKNITGKYVEISPTATEKMSENTTFEYITDIYQLLPYEIADIGNININLV